MTGRLREHLLRRLRHDARLRALEDATARGILASGDRDGFGDDSPRLRIRRTAAEEDSFWQPQGATKPMFTTSLGCLAIMAPATSPGSWPITSRPTG